MTKDLVMQALTKAEEELMQHIWRIESGYLKDIVACYPEPRPAPTTVATILKILESKDFVGHEVQGKTNRYFPLISKSQYSGFFMQGVMQKYFGNSVPGIVSFFAETGNITTEEADEIIQLLNRHKAEK